MNKEQLYRFISGSNDNESNICQIYVIKGGRTVYDECWHGYTTEDAVNVNSVTKGIMGLLAGIALDQGCIRSIDQELGNINLSKSIDKSEIRCIISGQFCSKLSLLDVIFIRTFGI